MTLCTISLHNIVNIEFYRQRTRKTYQEAPIIMYTPEITVTKRQGHVDHGKEKNKTVVIYNLNRTRD